MIRKEGQALVSIYKKITYTIRWDRKPYNKDEFEQVIHERPTLSCKIIFYVLKRKSVTRKAHSKRDNTILK